MGTATRTEASNNQGTLHGRHLDSDEHHLRVDLPGLRAQIDRDDADRCVHLFPRVRGLRHPAET
jgi:hypothetical protein